MINIKKRRVFEYFINAASDIAREDGIDKITIRNVSDRAGYNGATLYNYFSNLEQLLAFTVIHSITEYLYDIDKVIKSNEDCLVKYILAWNQYCFHSFNNPNVYTYAFDSTNSTYTLSQIENYMKVFPERIMSDDKAPTVTVIGGSIEEREMDMLEPCISKGYMTADAARRIYNLGYLLQQGTLYRLMHNKEQYPVEEARITFIHYFIDFINSQLLPNVPTIIFEDLKEVLAACGQSC